MSTSRSNGPSPKGFVPKAPTRTSTQKRDQSKDVDEKDSESPTSNELSGPNKKVLELKVDSEKKWEVEEEKKEVLAVAGKVENGNLGRVSKDDTGLKNENVTDGITSKGREEKIVENKYTAADKSIEADKKLSEEASIKLKLEREAELRNKEIARLAEESFLRGEKLFVFPQVVKPDQDIEVFFNRSLSTLNNEADVLIMGAFNDWRWKSFTRRLNKTNVNGDWLSCEVHVPKEAYKMDFVFFNGQSVYDNNDKKDFCIPVEGGMDVFSFEDFLLEEKRREQEKIAKEKAERERQAEEQRRIEAERAASEADREQARKETERRKELLNQLIKKAARSVENVWYIEPSDFKVDDLVRLYYNRSSGPLAHAQEIWIHGGHNNWKDGLSIAARLVRSETKDGDWWYAKGMCIRVSYLSLFCVLSISQFG